MYSLLIRRVRKKIFRVSPEDENDLRLLVEMIRDYYVTQRVRDDALPPGPSPNDSSVIRALIRSMFPVAAACVAAQRAEIRGENPPPVPPIHPHDLMVRLFQDGHLGA